MENNKLQPVGDVQILIKALEHIAATEQDDQNADDAFDALMKYRYSIKHAPADSEKAEIKVDRKYKFKITPFGRELIAEVYYLEMISDKPTEIQVSMKSFSGWFRDIKQSDYEKALKWAKNQAKMANAALMYDLHNSTKK